MSTYVIDGPFVLSLYNQLNGFLKPSISDNLQDRSEIKVDYLNLVYNDKKDEIRIECIIPDTYERKITYRICKDFVWIIHSQNINSIEICHFVHVKPEGIMSTTKKILSNKKEQPAALEDSLGTHALLYKVLRQILPSLMRSTVFVERVKSKAPVKIKEVNENSFGEAPSKPLDKAKPVSEPGSNAQTTHQNMHNSNQSPLKTENPKVNVNEDCGTGKPTAIDLLEETQKKRLTAFEQEFNKSLSFLQNKTQAKFGGNVESQKEAFDTTQNLIKVLKDQVDLFTANPTQETYDKLKKDSTESIANARLVLDKHRGMTKIVLSVLATICTGGLYILAAALDRAITGKWTFFSTDTSNKVSAVENIISASPLAPKG